MNFARPRGTLSGLLSIGARVLPESPRSAGRLRPLTSVPSQRLSGKPDMPEKAAEPVDQIAPKKCCAACMVRHRGKRPEVRSAATLCTRRPETGLLCLRAVQGR